MNLLMPEVKFLRSWSGYTRAFHSLSLSGHMPFMEEAKEILYMKLWNYKELRSDERCIDIVLKGTDSINKESFNSFRTWRDSTPDLSRDTGDIFEKQGYYIDITKEAIHIFTDTMEGFAYALSTLKQLLEEGEGFRLPLVTIADWPSIEYRSLSTTFAWYAGYGRFGFDMQLWGLKEWKQFLNICSDYKMNQLNLCLYGYWPFAVEGYPEAEMKGIRMKIWNPESENWVEMEFMHPNIAEEFLPALIEYGHKLGISFYAYIGLNSYNGGYSNAHREKRMKMPDKGNFVNDFDSLCLSDETTLGYLKKCMRNIVAQGFDGIDFEESEEAFWYCNCPKCLETFWKGNETPEQTLHSANTWLLKIMYDELKAAKPDITIGIRAWRQPPLVRTEKLIESMKASIPEYVVLFWAPGQYVEDSEFEKWIKAFGRKRIRARDTEAIGFAAGLGRLIRPFKFNGLRSKEEPITQYIEEDIRQHRGSVRMKAAGINGYLFEWYGFFMAFFAHAYYSWGGEKEPEEFYKHVLCAVFGNLSEDIYFVMTNMLTIHESQLNIFEQEFPFAKNRVEERDIPRIQEAIAVYPLLMEKLDEIIEKVSDCKRMEPFSLHFKKWKISVMRSRVIYDMALESLQYERAGSEEEKRGCLCRMYLHNEKEFSIIRENYLDVNPCMETGISSCMIPYHELKRCILNRLYPEKKQEKPVYPGVEALGWMWF